MRIQLKKQETVCFLLFQLVKRGGIYLLLHII